MAKLNIYLGETPGDIRPIELSSEERFPSLHIRSRKPLDIPKEGEMVIRYEKTEYTESEHDGKKRYSCTIDVKELISAKEMEDESPPARSDNETGEALDRLMEEKRNSSNKGNNPGHKKNGGY